MSVMMVLTSIERISTPLTAVSKAMVAACEFFTIIDAPAPNRCGAKMELEENNGSGFESLSDDIVFENVTFAYPSRPGTKVLDRLSLRIRAGLNTAIVGPSGSGKSTIVALLERWYSLSDEPGVLPRVIQPEPNQSGSSNDDDQDSSMTSAAGATADDPRIELSGSILVAGHRIEDLSTYWWRSQIGLVQQEPFLFNDSIFENVARGLVGTQWANESEFQKRQLVEHACKEAYAHEFICRLPEVSRPLGRTSLR